jgi:hypothetical protein
VRGVGGGGWGWAAKRRQAGEARQADPQRCRGGVSCIGAFEIAVSGVTVRWR